MSEETYFKSYGDVRVHALMLRDKPRVDAYAAAILQHVTSFKNAVVLDVGAGTGILSILAAKAGARRVFAIEASAGAFALLKEMVVANKCEDVVQPLQSRVEDLDQDALGLNKVDIIVSEWMGFFLLHESMLESVLYARDTWLKPGGLIFPETCAIHISLVSCPSLWDEKVGWTEDPIHGVDISCLKEPIVSSIQAQPEIDILSPEQCAFSSRAHVKAIDLRSVTAVDLQTVRAKGSLAVQDAEIGVTAHGFGMWFTVEFPSVENGPPAIVLSTGPEAPPTHWKQSILFFSEPKPCPTGLILEFEVLMQQDQQNKRFYAIEIDIVDAHIAE